MTGVIHLPAKCNRASRRSPMRSRRAIAWRAVAVTTALALVPFGSAQSQSQSSDLAAAASAPELSAGQAREAGAIPFSAHFEAVIDPLGPDHQDMDLALPESAVDLDTFDPPIEQDQVLSDLGSGVASFYGRRFHGRRTANGERFDMGAMTAAHRTLPFGSLVRVTNPRNGRSVTVRINDRGPYARGRTIDVSRAAAEELGMIRRGHARVELELLAP